MEAQQVTKRKSAKWDASLHVLFVRLCVEEVRKGNRPNTTLDKTAWTNVLVVFNRTANKDFTRVQLKNHWDKMKGEWKLFRKLRHGHTGLGWNEATKSIDATDEWWNARIQENEEYEKFRGKDLSIYWFDYDTLFADIVATGEKARAPNQRSAVGADSICSEEFVPTPPEDSIREGSGDSDEDLVSPRLFSTSFGEKSKGSSSGSKRKMSGTAIIRDGLENVMKAL